VDCGIFMADLAEMPHLLVAGATGMGKSVGLNVIISSLVNKKTPDELKMVLIDPKQVELTVYEKIAKPYIAKLTESSDAIVTDPDKALETLEAICELMEKRYAKLKDKNVRNIKEYNDIVEEKLPYYVVIIDEYGDLIMQSTGQAMEKAICRIAQKARAVGIHMIISTQRPSTDIVTGRIKANFPTRISFRTVTGTDSRVILDRVGAEKLTGKGDMLYYNGGDTTRCQCAYISTEEVTDLCSDIEEEYADCKQTTLDKFVPSLRLSKQLVFDRLYQTTIDFLPRLVGKDMIESSDIPCKFIGRACLINQLWELGLIGNELIKYDGWHYGYKVLVNDADEISRIAYSFYENNEE